MTPAEFESALTWMETRWGTLHKGWCLDVAALYRDFQHYASEDLTGALAALYGTGLQTCPAPSKLMKEMRERASATNFDMALLEAEPCDPRKHPWAILVEDSDGTRHALCARCHEEKTFSPGTLWTASEIDAGDHTLRAPTPEEVPY